MIMICRIHNRRFYSKFGSLTPNRLCRKKENHYREVNASGVSWKHFLYIGEKMNQLLEKFNDYKSIVNYMIAYEFEDDTVLEFIPKQTEFPHLLGLHKLVDIPIIRQFNDKNNKTVSAKFLISKIKKEEILTESAIKASVHFHKIEDRYNRFNKDNLLSLSYTDVILDFDSSKIGSDLKAKYVLFEEKESGCYNHLCIAEAEANKKYLESFFYEPSDLYLRNQKRIKIKKVKIFDNKGILILEDTLL